MGKEKGDAKSNFQLKVPKGTKDWEGKDMVIRDKIFSTITQVFKRHGAVTIDTLVNGSSPLVHNPLS
jgi:histidyl-tRNA synthetase